MVFYHRLFADKAVQTIKSRLSERKMSTLHPAVQIVFQQK